MSKFLRDLKTRIPTIGWIVFIAGFISMFFLPQITLTEMFVYMFIFLISTILLGISFFKTKSILMKIVHAAGCICSALWCVIYATGNTILTLYMFPLMLLTGIVFVAAGVNLLWIRLKAGAAGYGWNEGSDRYYQRKRR